MIMMMRRRSIVCVEDKEVVWRQGPGEEPPTMQLQVWEYQTRC